MAQEKNCCWLIAGAAGKYTHKNLKFVKKVSCQRKPSKGWSWF